MGRVRAGKAAACAVLSVVTLLLAHPVQAAPNDMEGVWRLSRPQSLLVPGGGGLPPFTKEGRARFEANRKAAARGDFRFDAVRSSCASPGQPRLMLSSRPFALFVRPRVVTLVYAWNHTFRQITVGEPLPNPASGPHWWVFGSAQGHATARWDGDTLVVKTDSFTDGRLLDAFTPTSDKLTLTERLRLRSPKVLEDRITVSDPGIFTRRWDAVLTYARATDAKLPFAEDVCLDRLKAGQPAWP
jgi:hypothetical protein